MTQENAPLEAFYPGCSGGNYDALDALKWLEAELPHPVSLLPLKKAEKRPAVKRWPDVREADRTEPGFRTLFTGQAGVGLLCGDPSSGLCFIDIDRDDFIDRLEMLFPPLSTAPRIFGARGCKWLFQCEGRQQGFALFDSTGSRIGEFLGERQQGVLAGIHPQTGKPYRWDRLPPIPKVDILPIRQYLSRNSPHAL